MARSLIDERVGEKFNWIWDSGTRGREEDRGRREAFAGTPPPPRLTLDPTSSGYKCEGWSSTLKAGTELRLHSFKFLATYTFFQNSLLYSFAP